MMSLLQRNQSKLLDQLLHDRDLRLETVNTFCQFDLLRVKWNQIYDLVQLFLLCEMKYGFYQIRMNQQNTKIRWVPCPCLLFKNKNMAIQDIKPAGNYMFKVNKENARTKSQICSRLTTKTPGRSGIFIVNFEHVSNLVLVFLLFLSLSR